MASLNKKKQVIISTAESELSFPHSSLFPFYSSLGTYVIAMKPHRGLKKLNSYKHNVPGFFSLVAMPCHSGDTAAFKTYALVLFLLYTIPLNV